MSSLSIIVVTAFNGREFVSQFLRSVLKESQSFPREIFVVDNASTDDTAEFVKKNFPEVCMIQNDQNLGFARGNNIALARSTGDYVCLINPDVVVLDDCLKQIVAFMEAHPDVGLLGPQIVSPDGSIQRSCMRFPNLWNCFCRAIALDSLFPRSAMVKGQLMPDFNHQETRDVDIMNGCFWVARREALAQVGSLDERFFMYGEDLDWCRRFHDAGWRVVYFPGAKAIHYGGGMTSHAPVHFYIYQQIARTIYWQKHHTKKALFLFELLTIVQELTRVVGYGILSFLRRSHRRDADLKIKRSMAYLRWTISHKPYQYQ